MIDLTFNLVKREIHQDVILMYGSTIFTVKLLSKTRYYRKWFRLTIYHLLTYWLMIALSIDGSIVIKKKTFRHNKNICQHSSFVLCRFVWNIDVFIKDRPSVRPSVRLLLSTLVLVLLSTWRRMAVCDSNNSGYRFD